MKLNSQKPENVFSTKYDPKDDPKESGEVFHWETTVEVELDEVFQGDPYI